MKAVEAGNRPKNSVKKLRGRPFKKGQSGNPSGRPKFDPDVKHAFVKLAPIALAQCEKILTKKKAKDSDIIKASALVFAYAYGKPLETVVVTQKDYVVVPAPTADEN